MFPAPSLVFSTLYVGFAALLSTFVFLLLVFPGPGAGSLDCLRYASRSSDQPKQPVRRAHVFDLLETP